MVSYQLLMRSFSQKSVADHFSLPTYYIGTVVNVSTTSIQKVNPFHVASTTKSKLIMTYILTYCTRISRYLIHIYTTQLFYYCLRTVSKF